MKFEELKFEQNLMEGIVAMNFQEMTPIQEQAIPLVMEGRDVIACAQTGTGKTAAYLLPLLNRMLKEEHDSESVNAIIMAPTRELAQQIDQQLEGFSYFLPITSVPVYGGNDASAWEQQKRAMQMGADFVIATPGRLISHINLGYVDFSKVNYFVLDEADRMLDMGFYDDIIHIVKQLPKERQTIMFSATMPKKIRTLAEAILDNPATVDIAISKPAEGIVQEAYICYESQKLGIIQNLLKDSMPEKVIVFSSSKQKVREVTRSLKQMHLLAEEIHSDLEQSKRDEALLSFKNGKVNVLVATDIVSRGIDIENIDMVINFDVPSDTEDYIHRIGRTARAQKTGRGITFVSEKEQNKFRRIELFLDKEIDKCSLPEYLGEAPEYSPKGSLGRAKQGWRRKRRFVPSKAKKQNFAKGQNGEKEQQVQNENFKHHRRRGFKRKKEDGQPQ